MKKKPFILAFFTLGLSLISAYAGEEWETNFKEACAKAQKEGKYVLADFSGSDWCGWCVKLDKEVFSQDIFQEYAKDNLVCVLLDFPKKKSLTPDLKKQNRELAEKYRVKGFPTVLIISPEGEFVEKTGYKKGGAENYVNHLKKIISQYEKNAKNMAKHVGADGRDTVVEDGTTVTR